MIFLPIGVESMEITRGDIFIADLNPVQGSEQGGVRPVLVIQNDRGNRFSPTVICAAMTSRVGKSDLPTHAWVSARDSGLKSDSLVLCEQIRTLEKRRLRARAGRIDGMAMARVERVAAGARWASHNGKTGRLKAGGGTALPPLFKQRKRRTSRKE